MKEWKKPQISTVLEEELAKIISASACSNKICYSNNSDFASK
ncbi:MAG: hypothetical protein ACYCYI_09325 [Saccharofermentanales bacterium]